MNGERRDGAFNARENRIGAAEMVEDDHPAAGATDAPHLASDGHRIGHDADHVRRVDDVEGVVSESEIRRIHLLETNVRDALLDNTLVSLLEHEG